MPSCRLDCTSRATLSYREEALQRIWGHRNLPPQSQSERKKAIYDLIQRAYDPSTTSFCWKIEGALGGYCCERFFISLNGLGDSPTTQCNSCKKWVQRYHTMVTRRQIHYQAGKQIK